MSPVLWLLSTDGPSSLLFTDPTFLLRFLPLSLAAFFLALAVTPRSWRASGRRFTFANLVLLASGLWFLLVGAGVYAPWLVGLVVGNYVAGLSIDRLRQRAEATGASTPLPEAMVTLALTANLVMLLVSKYALALPEPVGTTGFAMPQLLAPLGMLVVVCQATSYVVDVFRGEFPAQRSPIRAGVYMLCFPLLCAGPLVRYGELGRQLADRRVTLAGFSYGMRRWFVGYCKVALFARILGEPVDLMFGLGASELGVGTAWLGAVFFTLQIYLDLSGYADMAIGFGRMYGFRVGEHFRWPYGADSLTEFWRRWQVTLGDWCAAYLRVSLDPESERSRWLDVRSVILLFVALALWHGPGWTVALWAGLHGLLVVVERHWLSAWLTRLPAPVRRVYLLLTLVVLWVLFRAPSLDGAGIVLRAMLGLGAAGGPIAFELGLFEWVAIALAALSTVPVWPSFSRWLVAVDALTTSTIILLSASFLYLWRSLVRGVWFVTGRSERHKEPEK